MNSFPSVLFNIMHAKWPGALINQVQIVILPSLFTMGVFSIFGVL